MRLLICLVVALLSHAGGAHAQYYNPNLPSPPERYPLCGPEIDLNKPRICTANPDLRHTRLECPNDRCTEDLPDIYERLQNSSLEQVCPSRSCTWGYFVRNDEPGYARCLYRIVPTGYEDPDPDVRRFDVQVSQLVYERNLTIASPNSGGLYKNFGRRYKHQADDQKSFRDERGFRIYTFRGQCRW